MSELLPKLLSFVTGKKRYKPEIKWSDNSWTHNVFRFYESLFGRKFGIRAEIGSRRYTDKDGNRITRYEVYTFEGACALAESYVRNFFKEKLWKIEVKAWELAYPVNTPQLRVPFISFAIAYDTVSNGGSWSGGSDTWSHTCTGSDRLLVVCYGVRDSSATDRELDSGSYNSVALVKIRSTDYGLNDIRTEIWNLIAPATGANNVTLNNGAVTTTAGIGAALSLTGVDQTTYNDADNGASGTAATATVAIVTVADNAWIVDCMWTTETGGSDITAGGTGSHTERLEYDGNISDNFCVGTAGAITPAGSTTVSWSWTGTEAWAITAASFKPAGGATNVTVNPSVQSVTASIPSYTVSAIQNVSVAITALSLAFTIPAYTVDLATNNIETPSVQTVTFSIPSPTVSTVQNVTVSPNVQTATFTIPAYTIATAGWYDTDWLYRVKITVQNSKVDADLTGYPVYLDLADLPAEFHSHVNQTDGRDIRITTDDGTTEVPVEVVYYNSTTDSGEIHFKADLLNSTDVDFYVYYGNAGASMPAANSTYGKYNVWDSDYLLVLHFGDGSSLSIADSTSYQRSLSNNNGVSAIAGQVGGAAEFVKANSEYLEITDHADFRSLTDLTIEVWAYLDESDSDGWWLMGKNVSNSSAVDPYEDWAFFGNPNGSTIFRTASSPTTGWSDLAQAASYMPFDTWVHIAATYDTSTMRNYKNGVASGTTTSTTRTTGTSTANPRIGTFLTSTYNYDFDGYMDEVRFSKIARSATWLSTQYNNHSDPDTFYTAGDEEESPAGSDTEVFANAQTATFSLPSVTVTAVQNVSTSAAVQSAAFSIQAYATTQGATISPSALTANFSVPTPSVLYDYLQAGTVQTATFSIPSPAVLLSVTESPATQTCTFSILAVSVTAEQSTSISAGVQSLSFTSQAVTVTTISNITVSPAAQTATFNNLAPEIHLDFTVSPSVQNVIVTIPAVTVSIEVGVTVSPDVQTAAFSLNSPEVSAQQNTEISPAVQSVTTSAPAYSVIAVQNVSISPSALSLIFSVPTYAVNFDIIVQTSVLSAQFSAQAVTVEAVQNTTVNPTALSAAFSIIPPDVTGQQNITTEIAAQGITLSIPAYTIIGETRIDVGVQTLTFSLPTRPIIRVFPYFKKTSPYTNKISPYSNQSKPYAAKTSPYAKTDSPYTPLSQN